MRFLPIVILIALGCSNGIEPEPKAEPEPKPQPKLRLIAPHQVAFPEELLESSEIKAIPHQHEIDTVFKGIPDFQIIHIRNWHFVDRNAFEADGGKDWEAFLKSVEAVQQQQIEVLKYLRDKHGIKAVFLEGMTDADLDEYKKLAGALASWKEPAGDDSMSQFLRQQHREDTLQLGAAARVEGLEVLPAEDAEALEAADPKKPGYSFSDKGRREDAIVRRLRNSGHRVAVLILGGDHHLGLSTTANSGGNAAYARIQVEAHCKAEIEKGRGRF